MVTIKDLKNNIEINGEEVFRLLESLVQEELIGFNLLFNVDKKETDFYLASSELNYDVYGAECVTSDGSMFKLSWSGEIPSEVKRFLETGNFLIMNTSSYGVLLEKKVELNANIICDSFTSVGSFSSKNQFDVLLEYLNSLDRFDYDKVKESSAISRLLTKGYVLGISRDLDNVAYRNALLNKLDGVNKNFIVKIRGIERNLKYGHRMSINDGIVNYCYISCNDIFNSCMKVNERKFFYLHVTLPEFGKRNLLLNCSDFEFNSKTDLGDYSTYKMVFDKEDKVSEPSDCLDGIFNSEEFSARNSDDSKSQYKMYRIWDMLVKGIACDDADCLEEYSKVKAYFKIKDKENLHPAYALLYKFSKVLNNSNKILVERAFNNAVILKVSNQVDLYKLCKDINSEFNGDKDLFEIKFLLSNAFDFDRIGKVHVSTLKEERLNQNFLRRVYFDMDFVDKVLVENQGKFENVLKDVRSLLNKFIGDEESMNYPVKKGRTII